MFIVESYGIIETSIFIWGEIMNDNISLKDDNWISLEEAADYLGVKPITVREWIKKINDIPAHKIGKQWKFKRTELDSWVKSGKSALK